MRKEYEARINRAIDFVYNNYQADFELTALADAAWDALMGEWLPSSGWQPDERMCYELYLNDHEQHPERQFIVDICEPVKPL